MPDERAAPPVTLAGAGDLLSAGPDRPPRLGPAARRGLRSAGAALAAAVAVAVVVDGRSDAQRQRDARVLDLTVLPGATVSSSLDGGAVATLRLELQVRNEGPRPVRVLSGGIGGYGVSRPTELRPAAVSPVRLERSVQCRKDDPPVALASDTLRLSVRTGAGTRNVELPLPLLLRDAEAQRACGFLPPKPTS